MKRYECCLHKMFANNYNLHVCFQLNLHRKLSFPYAKNSVNGCCFWTAFRQFGGKFSTDGRFETSYQVSIVTCALLGQSCGCSINFSGFMDKAIKIGDDV